jgi:hypothetical protein
MSDDTGAGAGSGPGVGTLDRPPEPDDRAVLAGLIWTLYDDLDAVSALRFELFVPGPNDDVAASVELGEFLNLWGPAWTEIAATRDAVVGQIRSADRNSCEVWPGRCAAGDESGGLAVWPGSDALGLR